MNKGNVRLLTIWRFLLLSTAAILAWRLAALGLSGYYLERLREGDAGAARRVLAWSGRQPVAAYHEALRLREEDPAAAESLLRAAYTENPAEGRPLLVLAGLAQAKGDRERAAALVEQAAKLMPADPAIQREAAAYWVSQGRLEQAMQHWSQALDADPSVAKDLFPILLKIVEDPGSRGVFKSMAVAPPTWWDRFFAEAMQRALDVEAVRMLYALRRDAVQVPITIAERKAYIARLQREGLVTEAYLVWVNGLSETERASLGILNNGSFELEPSNSGFDWHVVKTDDVAVTTATTYGVQGDKALHLIFKRRDKPFRHLYQPLFLDPAGYRVTGQVRTDSLTSTGGLKWAVRCSLPDGETLGESERFLGSGEWREFFFEFQVPADCTAQEIRLVSAGTREFEHKIAGGIWFDTMAMRKIPPPQTIPNQQAAPAR